MISVIIPTRNEENYIGRTLRSLKNQNYKGKYEVIVADTSTDRTVEIARRHADKIVKVKRRGISAGRNAGAKAAKGNILFFVDADTELKEDALYRIDNEFKDPRVAAVSGRVLPDRPSIKNDLSYGFFFLLSKLSSYTGRPLLPGYLMACRREAFEREGGFNPNVMAGEDIELSRNMGKDGRCVVINDVLATTSPRRIESMSILHYLYMYFGAYIKGKAGMDGHYAEIR